MKKWIKKWHKHYLKKKYYAKKVEKALKNYELFSLPTKDIIKLKAKIDLIIMERINNGR